MITDWKMDLFRRITDRAFLLTVTVLILAQVMNMTPEQLMSYMAVIAPFVFGEKFKDAKAIQAQLESVKLPETMNAAGDVNVNQGAAQSTPAPALAPFSQSSEAQAVDELAFDLEPSNAQALNAEAVMEQERD